MGDIRFYSAHGEYGYMSNFYHAQITINGKRYATTEHYFQSQKFTGTHYETMVRNCASPREAAKTGRRRDLPIRRDWESVKDNVMRTAIRAKFTQHADLKQKLLQTGTARLIEHTEKDSYWADGGNGSGKNMLGMILMEIRKELNGI